MRFIIVVHEGLGWMVSKFHIKESKAKKRDNAETELKVILGSTVTQLHDFDGIVIEIRERETIRKLTLIERLSGVLKDNERGLRAEGEKPTANKQ